MFPFYMYVHHTEKPHHKKDSDSSSSDDSDDDYELIILNEDDDLCVGVSGGKAKEGKYLKLVDCDEDDDEMLWKKDSRGRIKAKEEDDGDNLW